MNIVVAFIIHAVIVVAGLLGTGFIVATAIRNAASRLEDKDDKRLG